MDPKKVLLFAGILMFSFSSQAQRRLWDGEYNRLGLQGGVNHFDIITNDLQVTPKVSWTAGFTTRASFYNDFQLVYGINFYDLKVDIDGRKKLEETSANSLIEYSMIGVQGNFFASYKLIDHYLSVEAGPVVQVNGKMEARQDKELYYVGSYDINAIDLEKVSAFNLNLAVGISGGGETLKIWAQYQYGINNFFKGLHDEGLQEKDASVPSLKGNISMIAGGVTFYL
ncbi:outer membrane beta-barrel protein [Salinimicrobium sp. TH3]|uniref:outer membrane beta-barrel protein n=1 Tax=Salinimicrobium sp. TH3 TaxID=2997342 RepID=UPI00227436C4|nr:outer membrane beta-barrel protein [Salinimicrobium sp. TH3]MCY2686527.1 outer membrane beta-barrel protein [Salinimicrobium sp. TH3]